MPCSLFHEHCLFAKGLSPVVGIDEAGRGPLGGPVVVGAVILPPNFVLAGLNDSKKLTAKARERLYAEITENPEIRWTSSAISPQEIDRLNILGATHSGMRAVVEQLSPRPAHALIDGLPVRNFPCPQTALVGGDGISLSIAAASIIANAVNVAHSGIGRQPANSLRDMTDLGDLQVTVDVPSLPVEWVQRALHAGWQRARECQAQGLIAAAALVCQGQSRLLTMAATPEPLSFEENPLALA